MSKRRIPRKLKKRLKKNMRRFADGSVLAYGYVWSVNFEGTWFEKDWTS